jgi:hypothetical protein
MVGSYLESHKPSEPPPSLLPPRFRASASARATTATARPPPAPTPSVFFSRTMSPAQAGASTSPASYPRCVGVVVGGDDDDDDDDNAAAADADGKEEEKGGGQRGPADT